MTWELRDVTPDMWLWRVEYPDWRPEAGWEPMVSSTCAAVGGEVVFDRPEGRNVTPLGLPEQRTLVFADALTAQGDGELRVWSTPWHEDRALTLPPWND